MSDTRRNFWAICWIIYFVLLVVMLSNSANAAKSCADDQTIGLSQFTPNVNMTAIPGEKVTSMGESNTSQIFQHVRSGSLTLVNGADGGCTIGNYARHGSTKGKECWSKIPKDADIVWMKPILRSKGIDIDEYNRNLEEDIRTVLNLMNDSKSNTTYMPSLRTVWVSGHHATPWSVPNSRGKPPKQGERYSHDSGIKAAEVVDSPPAGLSFRVEHGPNLWRPGHFWTCDLFRDDGVHQTDAGQQIAADMLTDAIAVALGNDPGDPPPPPDPDPEPQACPADGFQPGQTCSVKRRRGDDWCICANPWARVGPL